MNKKDRIAVVVSVLCLFMLLPLLLKDGSTIILYTPVVLYWAYRFVKNDISFLKLKE